MKASGIKAICVREVPPSKGGNRMNTFEFALKMELDGKAYYEKLAAETKVAGLKTIFSSLANDEQKHYNIIKQLQEDAWTDMVESHVLDKAKNVFEQLRNGSDFAVKLAQTLEGYQHARKIEADSVIFYESMAKKEINPDIAKIILRIAAEEKEHYNIMDNLCDYALAPQYFLAWGEFSNLKEL
jgi:rubrerythrin